MACRLGWAKEWKTRIMCEAQMHSCASFNTLTYNDANLPADYGLHVRDIQLFMKRARKKLGKIRFFACGEYGDENQRPHYHVILFGADFSSDRKLWRVGKNGDYNYRSALLEQLWPFGFAETSSLSHDNAGYTARYMVKKINGERAKDHYTRTHPHTGLVSQVHPEFITMSTTPGIGASFFEKYRSDCFPSDFLILQGEKVSIPRYYLKLLARMEEQNPSVGLLEASETVKLERQHNALMRHLANPNESSQERREVKEQALILKAERLKRPL